MWIVLELWPSPENTHVVSNEDGESVVFETEEEAKQFADEECQDGIVVQIG
jgi:hypothetical protein